jgi:hypothetical protein
MSFTTKIVDIAPDKRAVTKDHDFESIALSETEDCDDCEYEIVPEQVTGAPKPATAAVNESTTEIREHYRIEARKVNLALPKHLEQFPYSLQIRVAIQVCATCLSGASDYNLYIDMDTLMDGLRMLHTATEQFHDTKNTTGINKDRVMFALRSITPQFQRALAAALATVTGAQDWYAQDLRDVEAGDFEISAVVWAVVLGPVGLAACFKKDPTKGSKTVGKATGMLLEAEETWILEHIGNEQYEDEKQVLEDFADELCVWGEMVAGMAPGLEYQAK